MTVPLVLLGPLVLLAGCGGGGDNGAVPDGGTVREAPSARDCDRLGDAVGGTVEVEASVSDAGEGTTVTCTLRESDPPATVTTVTLLHRADSAAAEDAYASYAQEDFSYYRTAYDADVRSSPVEGRPEGVATVVTFSDGARATPPDRVVTLASVRDANLVVVVQTYGDALAAGDIASRVGDDQDRHVALFASVLDS